jgi:hypothetical protein
VEKHAQRTEIHGVIDATLGFEKPRDTPLHP